MSVEGKAMTAAMLFGRPIGVRAGNVSKIPVGVLAIFAYQSFRPDKSGLILKLIPVNFDEMLWAVNAKEANPASLALLLLSKSSTP